MYVLMEPALEKFKGQSQEGETDGAGAYSWRDAYENEKQSEWVGIRKDEIKSQIDLN